MSARHIFESASRIAANQLEGFERAVEILTNRRGRKMTSFNGQTRIPLIEPDLLDIELSNGFPAEVAYTVQSAKDLHINAVYLINHQSVEEHDFRDMLSRSETSYISSQIVKHLESEAAEKCVDAMLTQQRRNREFMEAS